MVERQLPKQGTMNGLAVVSSPISPSPEPKWATSVKEGGNDSCKYIHSIITLHIKSPKRL